MSTLADDWEKIATIAMLDVLTLQARCISAEALLLAADEAIDVLKGDADYGRAAELLAAIEKHWQTYPEPLADE